MEIVLGLCTILGGIAAVLYFIEKRQSQNKNKVAKGKRPEECNPQSKHLFLNFKHGMLCINRKIKHRKNAEFLIDGHFQIIVGNQELQLLNIDADYKPRNGDCWNHTWEFLLTDARGSRILRSNIKFPLLIGNNEARDIWFECALQPGNLNETPAHCEHGELHIYLRYIVVDELEDYFNCYVFETGSHGHLVPKKADS